jgi:hypothetical protein
MKLKLLNRDISYVTKLLLIVNFSLRVTNEEIIGGYGFKGFLTFFFIQNKNELMITSMMIIEIRIMRKIISSISIANVVCIIASHLN